MDRFGRRKCPEPLDFVRSPLSFWGRGSNSIDLVFSIKRLMELEVDFSPNSNFKRSYFLFGQTKGIQSQTSARDSINMATGGPIDTEKNERFFSARLETNSFEDGLARNAHRVSSAIRRNFGRNFAQLGRKSAQPSAILTTAQILGHYTSAKSLATRNVSGIFFAKNIQAQISVSIGPPYLPSQPPSRK